MIKKTHLKWLLICLFLLNSLLSNAQVGIGTTTPNGALDITSTTDGLLIPRVALTNTTSALPLTTPTTSEIIYNTTTVADVTPGYYYWNGTIWVRLLTSVSAGWNTTGNTGTSSSTNFVGTTDAVDFITRTNNTEKMRVTSAGNVGIGSNAPTKLLEVGSATAGAESAILIKGGSGATYAPASFADYNGGVIQSNTQTGVGQFLNIAATGANTGNWSSNILFHTRQSGGTNSSERMRITGSGNVGIGTTTPTARLDVTAGTTTTQTIVNATGSINDFLQFNVQNTSTGTQAQSGYSATADNGTATTGFAWMGINNSAFNFPTAYNIGGANDVTYVGSGQDMHIANANNTRSIIFSTGIATSPFFSERMRITNAGNVGIGIAAPGAKLNIFDSSSSSSNVLKIGNNAGSYDFFVANDFNSATYGSGGANYSGNGYANALVMNLAGVGHFIFGDDIGPWADANYDIGKSWARWRNIFASNGTINTSDARVKSNIKQIPFGLQTVLKMKPVIYDKYVGFEKTGDAIVETGFLAQELQELVPSAVVGETNGKNPMGIYYTQIIPVLTKAIQDQNAILESLQKKLENLEAKNKELESLILKNKTIK